MENKIKITGGGGGGGIKIKFSLNEKILFLQKCLIIKIKIKVTKH